MTNRGDETHSLLQTALSLPSDASGSSAVGIVETLHRIPGVLNAALSESDRRITVLHDSAVSVPTIVAAARSVATSVVLAKEALRVPRRGAPEPGSATIGARQLAIALMFSVLTWQILSAFAASGSTRIIALWSTGAICAAFIIRPLFSQRPRR